MTGSVLMGFQVFFLMAGMFLLMREESRRAGAVLTVIAVKAGLAGLVLGGGQAAPGGAEVMAVAGFSVLYLFILAALLPEKGAGRPGPGYGENAVFAAALILIAVFSAGCSREPGRKVIYPAVQKEIKTGFVPSALAEFEKGRLLAGLESGDTVRIINPETGEQEGKIQAGIRPVAYQAYGHFIYIANEGSGTVTVHDTVSGESKNIPSGGGYPSAIRLDPKKNVLYCANMESSNVSVIDLGTMSVRKKIQTGKWPSDLLLSKDGKYLFVACKYTNTVEIIDADKEQPVFTRVNTGTSPSKLIPLSRRHFIILNEWEYAFNNRSTLIFFDMSDYTVRDSIMVEGGMFDGVLSRSKRCLYVTSPVRDRVVFIDLGARQAVYEIKIPEGVPKWAALSRDGRHLYVSCRNKKIIVIALNDLS